MKQLKSIINILFLVVLALASCKDESLTDLNNLQASPTRGALSGQMGQEQRLGYGYNAAYTITDKDAFSTKPILNYNNLLEVEERYGQIFSEEPRHITVTDILTGNTLQELSHSETKSETDFSGLMGCGKTYSKETTVITKSTLQEDVAKVKIKTVVSSRTVDVGMLKSLNMSIDPKDDNSILAPEYRTAVNDLVRKYGANVNGITLTDAEAFCQTFGTHLVVSADLGGVVELQMAIDRSSCIEITNAVEKIQSKIFGIPGKSNTQKWSSVDSLKNLEYRANLFVYGGSEATIKAMQTKVSQEVQGTVATSEYRDWAASIVCKPGTSENNATFVRGRYVPLYELVPEDQVAARQVLTRIYELYLKETAPTADNYEPPYGYFDVRATAANDTYLLPNSNVRVVKVFKDTLEHRAALLCMEYVPSIRGDKPCVVAYPLIRGNDGKHRPYLYNGYFVGDESHRPGVVKWQGSASFYVPSDTIYYGKDAKTNALFDPVSKSLKKLYVYWNNVRPMPCPAKADGDMNQYDVSTYVYLGNSTDHPVNFAKVGDTFWSVKPVRCYTSGVDDQWGKYDWYKRFKEKRGLGASYYTPDAYSYMLGEGGNMPLTIADAVTPDFSKKVTKALSRTIAAYRNIIYEMPTREQAGNVGRMLGGRTFILFDNSFPDNRNILGLNWPDGYLAIGGAEVVQPSTMQMLDSKAKVILSREWVGGNIDKDNTDIVPVRIGASGSTTAFDYLEYISAFNFSSSQFYRYYPIYIVKQDFSF